MSSTEPSQAKPLSPLALSLLLGSVLWCVLWFVHSLGYWEDDSYIHLEFARSFATGHGFSFNGHVVYGDTSSLWVFLLAAFHLVIPDWMMAGKVLAALGVAFALYGAFAFARKLTGSALFAASMVVVLVANPYFTYWAFSGMETVTAAGLAMLAATLVDDRILTWRNFLLGCLLAGIGPLLRPEMVFLTVLLAAILLYRWKDIPGTAGSKLAGFLAGAVLAAGPSIAWAVYAVHVFGRIVPNTNAAKRALPSESISHRLLGVYGFGYPIIVLGLLAGLVYAAVSLRRSSHRPAASLGHSLGRLPVAAWVFVVWTLIASVFYVVNHTLVQTRYILPSASGLTIVVLAIVYRSWPRLFRPVWIFAAIVAAGFSLLYTWPNVHNKAVGDRAIAQMSFWIAHNLPPDAPVAAYAIGEVAFLSQHPIVDTGGITRPGVIPYLYSGPLEVERWLRGQGATYAIDGQQPEPGAVVVFYVDSPFAGWPLDPRAYYRGTGRYKVWKLPAQPQF